MQPRPPLSALDLDLVSNSSYGANLAGCKSSPADGALSPAQSLPFDTAAPAASPNNLPVAVSASQPALAHAGALSPYTRRSCDEVAPWASTRPSPAQQPPQRRSLHPNGTAPCLSHSARSHGPSHHLHPTSPFATQRMCATFGGHSTTASLVIATATATAHPVLISPLPPHASAARPVLYPRRSSARRRSSSSTLPPTLEAIAAYLRDAPPLAHAPTAPGCTITRTSAHAQLRTGSISARDRLSAGSSADAAPPTTAAAEPRSLPSAGRSARARRRSSLAAYADLVQQAYGTPMSIIRTHAGQAVTHTCHDSRAPNRRRSSIALPATLDVIASYLRTATPGLPVSSTAPAARPHTGPRPRSHSAHRASGSMHPSGLPTRSCVGPVSAPAPAFVLASSAVACAPTAPCPARTRSAAAPPLPPLPYRSSRTALYDSAGSRVTAPAGLTRCMSSLGCQEPGVKQQGHVAGAGEADAAAQGVNGMKGVCGGLEALAAAEPEQPDGCASTVVAGADGAGGFSSGVGSGGAGVDSVGVGAGVSGAVVDGGCKGAVLGDEGVGKGSAEVRRGGLQAVLNLGRWLVPCLAPSADDSGR